MQADFFPGYLPLGRKAEVLDIEVGNSQHLKRANKYFPPVLLVIDKP